MNVIDDYSGYHWTWLLKAKSDTLRILHEWLTAVEIQTGEKLWYLVSDNGKPRSHETAAWCTKKGITHQFTAPHTSAQNGCVKRLHCTLMNKVRAMCLACDAPLYLWDEFIQTASYLSMLTVSKLLGGWTPHELWFGSHPSISHLRKIGCCVYVLVSDNNPKIATWSLECVLISYAPHAKAYWCWEWGSQQIVDSHHVSFVKHLAAQPHALHPGVSVDMLPRDGEDGSLPTPFPQTNVVGDHVSPSAPSSVSALPSVSPAVEAVGEVVDAASKLLSLSVHLSENPSIIPSTNMNTAPSDNDIHALIAALLIDVEDPDALEWHEAIALADWDKWMEGAQLELDSLRDMEVYQLVLWTDIPANCSVLCGKFICRLKHNENGKPVRYKVRLVARGFQQVWGRDFSKTTSLTAQLESMHTILHLAASNDWSLRQYDMKTTFLNRVLLEDEIQFMEQPPGFAVPGKETYIWCLIHWLYGMQQSSCIWNWALHASFLGLGFRHFDCEWCIYSCCSDNGDLMVIVVHMDNMLVASLSKKEAGHFQAELEATWQISTLGEPKLIVGIALRQDRAARTIALSQTALIDKIMTTYGQGDVKPASTPMVHSALLKRPESNSTLEDDEWERLDRIPYRLLVGSLMYIASGTHPNIMFAISKLSWFLDCYREDHWLAAVRVIQYLKGTHELALHLSGPFSSFALLGYSDSDYANEPGSEGWRSVSGHCFTLGSGMVSWSLKKQNTIANSTCAAEYMAVSEAGRELVWLRTLLWELGYEPTKATPLLCNNSAAILLSADQSFHNCAKHLDVCYHWIRECVDRGELIVGQIATIDNIVDIFTKALPGPQFLNLWKCLGISDMVSTWTKFMQRGSVRIWNCITWLFGHWNP